MPRTRLRRAASCTFHYETNSLNLQQNLHELFWTLQYLFFLECNFFKKRTLTYTSTRSFKISKDHKKIRGSDLFLKKSKNHGFKFPKFSSQRISKSEPKLKREWHSTHFFSRTRFQQKEKKYIGRIVRCTHKKKKKKRKKTPRFFLEKNAKNLPRSRVDDDVSHRGRRTCTTVQGEISTRKFRVTTTWLGHWVCVTYS